MFNAFGNATQVPPANWRGEPTSRGTWNILSSCLITLGLCLWTALHLNVPRHKEGSVRPLLRKTGWLLLGLLAPEMVAYTAWHQRRAAYKLDAVMKRKLGQRPGPTRLKRFIAFIMRCCHVGGAGRTEEDVELDDLSSLASKRHHKWTPVHSFYVNMGGFAFDISDAKVKFLPNSRDRLALTPRGLMFLLDNEPDLIPDISREHICDKSKASKLVKTIVCLQALWFCVQCIARLGEDIAISLLELNVFGHAICALLMYFLWWDKPMDIEEPTLISGKYDKEICALMCMRSVRNEPDQDDGIYVEKLRTIAAKAHGTRNEFSGIARSGSTELPYGIRYGSELNRSIAEIPLSADDDYMKIKWYRLDRILVSGFVGLYYVYEAPIYKALLEFGLRKPKPGMRNRQNCRLHWTKPESGEGDPEGSNQEAADSVELDCPGDLMGVGNGNTSPSLEPTTAVMAGQDLAVQPNTGSGRITNLVPESLVSTNCVDGFRLTLGNWSPGKAGQVFEPRRLQADYAPTSVALSKADVVRWKLCARALELYCPEPEWVLDDTKTRSHQSFPAYQSVYDRSPNWPSTQHIESTNEDDATNSFAILCGFSFAGILYGGLHLLAWDAPFPSVGEHRLWQGSGILLASSGVVVIFFLGILMCIMAAGDWLIRTSLWKRFDSWLSTQPILRPILEFWFFLVCGAGFLPVLVFVVAYMGARVYLVVESFIQLAHLPDSAYVLPKWSQYYPHIT